MKRIIALVLALSLALLTVGCSSQSPSPSEPVAGGYSEDRDITDEDMAIFEEATAELSGVGYEPEKVATQVVSGTNYRFYCKSTTVTAEPEEGYAYVYIFKPLDDGPAEITETEEL